MVDVIMLTYNQEKYISKAIESVLNQNVELRLIIGEDCSTDNTKEICRMYKRKFSDKIVLLESEFNIGLVKNYVRCFNYSTSDFIAILEGDDYWIDNFKLSKQINILKDNPDIGLVHSNLFLLKEGNSLIKKIKPLFPEEKLSGEIFQRLLELNFIHSLTVVFRSQLLEYIDFEFLILNEFKTIDYFLWLIFSMHTKAGYLNEYGSVYRVLKESISHSTNYDKSKSFMKTFLMTFKYLYDNNYIDKQVYLRKHNEYKLELLIRAIKKLDFALIIENLNGFSISLLFKKLHSKLIYTNYFRY